MGPKVGSDRCNMENDISERNKRMVPKSDSVSLHVLEKTDGNSFGKAGSRRKLESQVEAGGLYSSGEAFEVLTWTQVIRAAL